MAQQVRNLGIHISHIFSQTFLPWRNFSQRQLGRLKTLEKLNKEDGEAIEFIAQELKKFRLRESEKKTVGGSHMSQG